MDTTPKITPSNANGFSEENQEGQVSPTLSKEVGGGLAKEGGGSKKPQNADDASGQYPSTPFSNVEKKVDEITPLLTGLSLSQIEMVLDKVKNRCYLYPILIAS